jgi:hypothetical protein
MNYKQVIENEINNVNDMKCNCNNMDKKYIGKGITHIATGCLDIVENEEIRELFKKGPNFRLEKRVEWDDIIQSLKENIRSGIEVWSRKENRNKEEYDEWRNMVESLVVERINFLKQDACNPLKFY